MNLPEEFDVILKQGMLNRVFFYFMLHPGSKRIFPLIKRYVKIVKKYVEIYPLISELFFLVP